MPSELREILDAAPFLMPNWKWIALLVLIFGGLSVRPLLQSVIKRIRRNSRFAKEHQGLVGHVSRLDLDRSLSWIGLCLIWFFALDNLHITESWEKYLNGGIKIIFAIHLIRALYCATDAVHLSLVAFAAKTETTLDDQLAPFASKTLKILIVIFGTLGLLKNLGVDVGSALAGLGIGALALAIAAQDTVSNVFGSINILLDTPFRIGDLVRIADVDGTVEEVGFRSTRIRTLTNALVIIPNSVVAKEKIENLTERKQRRSRQVLGLHYDTAPEKVIAFCEEIKYILKNEPLVNQET